LDYTVPKDVENPDKPSFILDGLIAAQKEYLQGFKGNPNTVPELFEEAMDPKHVALSLAGDATMYPLLPEMIDEIADKGMTSFVVTNGMRPDMLKKIVDHDPTQVYITLPAPTEEVYRETCQPLVNDGWERLNKSLEVLQDFKRSTIRLTLVKDMNMVDAEAYAKLLDNLDVRFIELKAAMPVGYAQYRMAYEAMPRHSEIMDFAERICNNSGLKVIDEKENSRVVLLARKDSEDRKLKVR
jgi:tRNA wybutosine-synthesizing protein 1